MRFIFSNSSVKAGSNGRNKSSTTPAACCESADWGFWLSSNSELDNVESANVRVSCLRRNEGKSWKLVLKVHLNSFKFQLDSSAVRCWEWNQSVWSLEMLELKFSGWTFIENEKRLKIKFLAYNKTNGMWNRISKHENMLKLKHFQWKKLETFEILSTDIFKFKVDSNRSVSQPWHAKLQNDHWKVKSV